MPSHIESARVASPAFEIRFSRLAEGAKYDPRTCSFLHFRERAKPPPAPLDKAALEALILDIHAYMSSWPRFSSPLALDLLHDFLSSLGPRRATEQLHQVQLAFDFSLGYLVHPLRSVLLPTMTMKPLALHDPSWTPSSRSSNFSPKYAKARLASRSNRTPPASSSTLLILALPSSLWAVAGNRCIAIYELLALWVPMVHLNHNRATSNKQPSGCNKARSNE